MHLQTDLEYYSGMVDRAAQRLGRKGGQKSRAYVSAEEATALSQHANTIRWEAYYAAHPEKLKAKLEREAKKGKVKRGRPPKAAK